MASSMNIGASDKIARPKRKRAIVNYAESQENDYDEDLSDEGYSSSFNEAKQSLKKAKTSGQKRNKAQKPFLFMGLPLELREMIYKLALTSEDGQRISATTKKQRHTIERGLRPRATDISVHSSWREESKGYYGTVSGSIYAGRHEAAEVVDDKLSPALLAVSRTIHDEAINFLYGQTFCFESTRALHDFLVTIGTENQARLLYITMLGYKQGNRSAESSYNYPAMTALGGACNLRSLAFALDFYYYFSGKRLAAKIYRDGFRFLERYGVANGSKDAAVRIIRIHASNFRSSYNNPTSTEDIAQNFQDELRLLINRPAF